MKQQLGLIREALEDHIQLVSGLLTDELAMKALGELAEKIALVFENGGKVLICGNGGSACDAMHFAEEFTGRFRKDRRALPVISVGDVGHLTCVANDFGFESVFVRQVEAFGKEGDLWIGLSTSGNSLNVKNALHAASSMGMETACFLGKDGGKLAGLADWQWIVPGKQADRIQEVHMLMLHILIEMVERILFPQNY